MRFRFLGPLRTWDGSDWCEVAAAQQRVVLAILLVEAGRVVTVDRLVDEIWGAQPPRTAVNTVQAYVMRLRRMLRRHAAVELPAHGRGYELAVGAEDIDATVFSQLTTSARQLIAQRRWDAAAEHLSKALELWQGPALADVSPCPTVLTERTRLDQLRISAMTDRLRALIEIGRHTDVIDDGYRLVQDHPLEERAWALTMRALQRAGRRVEALDTYRAARQALVSELGLEPGAELQALHRSILAGEADDAPVQVQAGLPPRPAQLPADVAGFTGRAEHLRRLGHTDRAVSVITGTAGVGKTALAVHWAHRMRDRYRDGQLWMDLRGYAVARPVRPIEALTRFLLALGVDQARIPDTEDDAAAMYRDLLAERRMLVVLDNARDPGQVRPLLPGSPGCAVLITSRDQLRELTAGGEAQPVPVDEFTAAEAHALVAHLVGDDRVRAEPEAVATLARRCGYLPLALRIAVANVLSRPHQSIADYAARLAGADRLEPLQVDGDPQATVRAAFDLSYLAQPDDARRLFRLIGLVPGPETTAASAAALAGLAHDQAAPLLDELAAAHLLAERAPGRYACHDLLRVYATSRATAEERGPGRVAAVDRLLRYYLGMVDAAARLLYPVTLRLPVPVSEPDRRDHFSDHAQASAWLDAERANLIAAVLYAAEHGPRDLAWLLADALRGYLQMGRRSVDWQTVSAAGLAAAEAGGDAPARAALHLSLGTLHLVHHRYPAAVDHLTSALEFARTAGWLRGQSGILGNFGIAYQLLGESDVAAEHLREALELDRRTGWLLGQAAKLHNLAFIAAARGELQAAVDQHAEAYEAFRQIGSRTDEAVALAGVGRIQHELGRLADAYDTLVRALDLHREVGDRDTEHDTMATLARVHADSGRDAEALRLAGTAATFAHDNGEPQLEFAALAIRARVHGRLDEHEEVLRLARELGNRTAEAEALIDLAVAEGYAGRLEPAQDHAEAALALVNEHGLRVLESAALTALAAVQLRRAETAPCIDAAGRALAVSARTGQRLGEARARLVLAAALESTGQDSTGQDSAGQDAAGHRAAATALFRETGAPEADSSRLLLGRSDLR